MIVITCGDVAGSVPHDGLPPCVLDDWQHSLLRLFHLFVLFSASHARIPKYFGS